MEVKEVSRQAGRQAAAQAGRQVGRWCDSQGPKRTRTPSRWR